MWARGRSRKAFDDEKKMAVLHKQDSVKRNDGNNSMRFEYNCGFMRLPKRSDSDSSTVRYIKHLGNKMVSAMRLLCKRGRASPEVSFSGKGKQVVVPPPDSHRAEAIDDCIEFINSSSSLQRSNSVPC